MLKQQFCAYKKWRLCSVLVVCSGSLAYANVTGTLLRVEAQLSCACVGNKVINHHFSRIGLSQEAARGFGQLA